MMWSRRGAGKSVARVDPVAPGRTDNFAIRSGMAPKCLTIRGARDCPHFLWITLWSDCHYPATALVARRFAVLVIP
jgi:hypothetical protein